MGIHRKGALVEYGSDVLGPLPNILVFQFNPEQISRTFNLPRQSTQDDAKKKKKEPAQVSGPPVESFSITAHFTAADDMGQTSVGSAVARRFGIGPQLAALEKMVYPSAGRTGRGEAAVVDGVGKTLEAGAGKKKPTRPTPREQLPRILFIWGLSRVLPVVVRSLSITEQKYDPLLNPVQAQVEIGLDVASFPKGSTDKVGMGALEYTQAVKDIQVALNLANAVKQGVEVVPF